MSASEARASLPALLDRVAAGDEVTITRHGQPVAVLIRPDALRPRRHAASLDAADEVRDALSDGRAAKLPTAGAGLDAERAEELIAAVRSGRDRA